RCENGAELLATLNYLANEPDIDELNEPDEPDELDESDEFDEFDEFDEADGFGEANKSDEHEQTSE
ncbi:MAG: hypothetical protein ACPG4T_19735, partial [Nannocystaceae bacterium]